MTISELKRFLDEPQFDDFDEIKVTSYSCGKVHERDLDFGDIGSNQKGDLVIRVEDN